MSDLGYDSLEFPANLLVKLLNLCGIFCGCLELRAQAGLQDALEEVHPGRDSLWHAQEVGGNDQLK